MKKYRRFGAALLVICLAPLILGSECDSTDFGSGGIAAIVDGAISLVLGILQLTL